MSEVTRILNAVGKGNLKEAHELLPLVYDELRKLAALKMAQQPAGQTLQATALVHEAWIRISDEPHDWKDRRHFFAAAAESMRRIVREVEPPKPSTG